MNMRGSTRFGRPSSTDARFSTLSPAPVARRPDIPGSADRRARFRTTATVLAVLVLVLAAAGPARAQGNATQQTNTEIVRSTSQTTASIISTRLELVNAPTPGQSSGGGAQPGGGQGGGQQEQSPGIPTPSKDSAALSPSRLPTLDAPARGTGQSVLAALGAIGSQTGLSAGDGVKNCGVWAMVGVSWLADFQTSSKFNGNLATGMIGFDYRPIDPLVVGLAAGYENLYLNTTYNSGWIKSEGLTVMPYASYALTEKLVADAAFGLTSSYYHTARFSYSEGREVNGNYPSLRVLGTANLTYYQPVDNWLFSVKAGGILANEHRYYHVENNGQRNYASDTLLGQLLVGGKAGYRLGGFMPQIGLTYVYDYATEAPERDRDELQGSAGINWRATDAVMVNVEAVNSFFRDNTQTTNLVGTLRVEF